MRFLEKLRHKGNNGPKSEEIKTFLNDSRDQLKIIASSATIEPDIRKELTDICTEIYDANEKIPGHENAQIDDGTICKIIKTSERIKELENKKSICLESKKVISAIASVSLEITQHFQTQTVSAANLC